MPRQLLGLVLLLHWCTTNTALDQHHDPPPLNYTALDYTGGAGPPRLIEILNTTHTFTVVQRNNFNFILINQFIVGATFATHDDDPEQHDFSDELAFQAWPLQAGVLYATCNSFRPAYKDPRGPTREAVIVPCKRPLKALLLGCGAGSIAGYLSRRKVTVDVVEYHAEIIALAQKYGGLHELSGKLIVGDALSTIKQGRMKIKRTRYNMIVHDLFDGSARGSALYEYDTFALLQRQWLMPNGVLVVNLLGSHVVGQPTYPFLHSVVRALRRLFGTVRCYREIPLDIHPDQILNVACYASNDARGIQFTLPDTVAYAPGDEYPTSLGLRSFQAWEVMAEEEGEREEEEVCIDEKKCSCVVVVDGAGGACLTFSQSPLKGSTGGGSGLSTGKQSGLVEPPLPLPSETWAMISNELHAAMEAHAVDLLGGVQVRDVLVDEKK